MVYKRAEGLLDWILIFLIVSFLFFFWKDGGNVLQALFDWGNFIISVINAIVKVITEIAKNLH